MTLNHSRVTLPAVRPLSLGLAVCGSAASGNAQGSFLNAQVLTGAGRCVDDHGRGNVCSDAITGGLCNLESAIVSPPTTTGMSSGALPWQSSPTTWP